VVCVGGGGGGWGWGVGGGGWGWVGGGGGRWYAFWQGFGGVLAGFWLAGGQWGAPAVRHANRDNSGAAHRTGKERGSTTRAWQGHGTWWRGRVVRLASAAPEVWRAKHGGTLRFGYHDPGGTQKHRGHAALLVRLNCA
jgi:hypothetical protein